MRFAAIGQGTAAKLRERGICADFVPEHFDGESLGRLLAETLEDGARILLARSLRGGKEILEEIEKNPMLGYVDLAVYDTLVSMETEEMLRSFMRTGTVTGVIFTSSSTVEGFCRMMGDYPYGTVKAVCMGEKTVKAARAAGMAARAAKNATVEALIECVMGEV